MHYYTFHIGDYRRDTAHLSRLEHSIYRDLIDWYYLDEEPLPVASQSLARRLRLGSDHEIEALNKVLLDFFFVSDGQYRHKRIDEDIKRYRNSCEKNRQNATAKRKKTVVSQELTEDQKPVASQSLATGYPLDTQTNNHKPITKEEKKQAKKETPRKISSLACPDDVDGGVWLDFLAMRKAKNAPMSSTALKTIRVESEKAGIDLQSALSECVARGWRGFKAEWVNKSLNKNNGNKNSGAYNAIYEGIFDE